jgi:predicted deacylase
MSKAVMRIGTAEAAPGTKANGVVHVANRPDGSSIFIPVMIVNGVEDGPIVGMDGCTHGNEYEGPEAIQNLVAQLEPAKMRGAFVGVPVVNILAFQAMQRVTPHDPHSHPDLNRNYPGRPGGGLTGRIAYAHLQQIVARTDVIITVHAGSTSMLPPKLIYHESDDELGRKSLEIAKAFGWEILWRNGSYPGTLHGVAEERGIVCIAPEFGGTDRMPHLRAERTDRLITGATNVMKYLGMLEGELKLPERWTVVEGESHVVANHGGLLIYEPGFELGKGVVSGQKIARIVDLYGNEVEAVEAPYDGLAIMMRTIPLVNAGDWVVGIGKYVRVIENKHEKGERG